MCMNTHTITIAMKNTIIMSITIIMERSVAADMAITMSTITSMNIIMMGSAVVAADTIMTMNIITIIMQMKCLQAGGRETIKTYSREEISRILKTLEEDDTYGTVLRAKGMVAGADGEWIYFDMVPQEHEVRSGAAEYTGRICVIGSRLEEDKLEALFGLKK